MSSKDLSPEPRAAVRVVRPGGNAAGPGAAPPMPVAPPNSLPPWLDPIGPELSSAATAATSSAAAAATSSATSSAASTAVDVDAELTPEQRQLRELLHRAVGEMAPSPNALEQLRRAVPRRRRRRRRIVGSVVATVALCSLGTVALHSAGTAVDTAGGPQAGRHYDDAASDGSDHGGVSATGSPHLVETSPSPGLPGVGSSFGGGHNAISLAPGGSGVLQSPPFVTRSPADTSGTRGSPGHSGGAPGSGPPVAECTRSQLGGGADSVGSPDAAGVVYGTFQVTDVSASSCQVSLPGAVSVLAVSGTDRSWISVAQHTAGDPAGGLPLPAASPTPVLLAPGGSYLVEFAWVPATGTAAPSCGETSTPGSEGSSAPVSGNNGTGASSGGGSGSSVTLGHTPGAGGSAAASAVISNACAGTVYRTDPLPAD
jgi:hypothetical protein